MTPELTSTVLGAGATLWLQGCAGAIRAHRSGGEMLQYHSSRSELARGVVGGLLIIGGAAVEGGVV